MLDFPNGWRVRHVFVKKWRYSVIINFEEELKKFHPSLEVDQAEEAIKSHDMTDLTDLLLEMVRGPVPTDGQAGE